MLGSAGLPISRLRMVRGRGANLDVKASHSGLRFDQRISLIGVLRLPEFKQGCWDMLSKKYAVMLATGVSVLAMGISAPAVAGPNPNNFGGHLQSNTPTTLTGSDNAPYTATILIDAGYNHPGGSSVTRTGSFAHPTAIATVTGALSTSAVNFGAFVQRAVISKTALATGTGDITLHLNVAASTESRPAAVISVGAHAQASATTLDNSAYAAAHINAGVDQFGAPVGQLSGYIANSGTIDVHADATAPALFSTALV